MIKLIWRQRFELAGRFLREQIKIKDCAFTDLGETGNDLDSRSESGMTNKKVAH